MATTSKQLIEILKKYTDPDEVVIWQYYTAKDFDSDISQKQFGQVADILDDWEIFSYAYDEINHQILRLEEKAVKS